MSEQWKIYLTIGGYGSSYSPQDVQTEINKLEAENEQLREENQKWRKLINKHRLGILKTDENFIIAMVGKEPADE